MHRHSTVHAGLDVTSFSRLFFSPNEPFVTGQLGMYMGSKVGSPVWKNRGTFQPLFSLHIYHSLSHYLDQKNIALHAAVSSLASWYSYHFNAKLLCQTSNLFNLVTGYQLPVHKRKHSARAVFHMLKTGYRWLGPVQEKKAATRGPGGCSNSHEQYSMYWLIHESEASHWIRCGGRKCELRLMELFTDGVDIMAWGWAHEDNLATRVFATLLLNRNLCSRSASTGLELKSAFLGKAKFMLARYKKAVPNDDYGYIS